MGQKDGGGAIKEEERITCECHGMEIKKGIMKAVSRTGFLVERLIKSLMA